MSSMILLWLKIKRYGACKKRQKPTATSKSCYCILLQLAPYYVTTVMTLV
ncbi:hypothetical protein GDO78_019478 [Eleutherodactylus coqui]|uniref:Uncharacterized protein n=1 Tax=Eleutherodactylus coqui TaxID=57060 RepID=A0A8J6EIK1_ELECQ|nr:hypothetical protein GDO78_019478 [Eleutherodactylus coqui]